MARARFRHQSPDTPPEDSLMRQVLVYDLPTRFFHWLFAGFFITAFANEIPAGALLLVSDEPMTPQGVKTAASDRKVDDQHVISHLRIGLDSLKQLINKGVTVKHLKF